MKTRIEKASEIGFCFGVRRAIGILEKKVKEYGIVESLGDVVHNEQVMQQLAEKGIRVVRNVAEIKGKVVAIGAHGVSPEVEAEIKAGNIGIIDTTCPFVKRVQLAARKLSEAGFYSVVYGDAGHAEVKGILGWAKDRGTAALDINELKNNQEISRRIGVLSQTTQIPEKFNAFVKDLVNAFLIKDVEIRIIDTICHDIRTRQTSSLDLAKKVDLMLVIGGRSSANTKRLLELCSAVTQTYMIDRPEEINFSWIKDKRSIGITSGTSTSLESIEEVKKILVKAMQENEGTINSGNGI